MANEGPDGPPAPPRIDKVQMNVRVPRPLRDQVDERRTPLGLSRDEWVARALRWALDQPPRTRRPTQLRGEIARNPTGRTVTGRRAK